MEYLALERKRQILGEAVIASRVKQSFRFMGFNELASTKKRLAMTRKPKKYNFSFNHCLSVHAATEAKR